MRPVAADRSSSSLPPRDRRAIAGHATAILLTFMTFVAAMMLTYAPQPVASWVVTTAWVTVGVAIVITVVLTVLENDAEREERKAIASKAAAKAAERVKAREELRAREAAARETFAHNRAEQQEKRTQKRKEVAEQANNLWAKRVVLAAEREAAIRAAAQIEKRRDVREAALQAAAAWTSAVTQAKWAAQATVSLTERPEITTEARDEAREKEEEAARIHESGRAWRPAQATALAAAKREAREEARLALLQQERIEKEVRHLEAEWRQEAARAERLEAAWKEKSADTKA